MELRLSCTNPFIYSQWVTVTSSSFNFHDGFQIEISKLLKNNWIISRFSAQSIYVRALAMILTFHKHNPIFITTWGQILWGLLVDDYCVVNHYWFSNRYDGGNSSCVFWSGQVMGIASKGLFQYKYHLSRYMISAGIILCIHPANQRRRYSVISSPIGWAHTQNEPCFSYKENGGETISMAWCKTEVSPLLMHWSLEVQQSCTKPLILPL